MDRTRSSRRIDSVGVAGSDDAGFVGEDDGLYPVAEVEFGEDAGDVAFHGGVAEVEVGCDLGIGEAAGEEPEDVEFALAEVRDGVGEAGGGRWSLAEVFDQAAGDGGCE